MPVFQFPEGDSKSHLFRTACGSSDLALEFKGRGKLSMALILLLQTVGPSMLMHCDIWTHGGFPFVDGHGVAHVGAALEAGAYARTVNVHSNNVEGNSVSNTQNVIINLHLHPTEALCE